MYTTATISAYDVLTNIHVEAVITRYDGMSSTGTEVIRASIDVPSDGEPEPTEWLRDVLIAVVETL